MPHESIEQSLARLEELKRRFDVEARKETLKLLETLSGSRFSDAASLIRFHEALLFLRAYPGDKEILEMAETELDAFLERVEALRSDEVDLSSLDKPEGSGIAGTQVTAAFSYQIVRWLAQTFPGHTTIDWPSYQKPERLAALSRFIPLLEEDAAVEANVPYLTWLQEASRGRKNELIWLVDCIQELPVTRKEKAALYDSLEPYVSTTLDRRSFSRTTQRLPARGIFYHDAPLIRRNEVSVEKEFAGKALALKKLSVTQGIIALNLARAASLVRYRELYGFTHGDAGNISRVGLGRGVEVLFFELAPEERLPLRAYHSGMIVKNGVPVGYFETLSLFDRCEVGFNLYYTFREGESAWLYARLLKLFHETLGVSYFSIDPYQVGFHNEEAIESGAFWFYRKLGFRPTRPAILKIVRREEKKIAARPNYRTPARTLRKIAEGSLAFDAGKPASEWDNFAVRKIGFAVQKRMAQSFGGSVQKMRDVDVPAVARILGVNLNVLSATEKSAFEPFAFLFSLTPDFSNWSKEEKRLAAQIVQAKLRDSEIAYLRLLQSHDRLRGETIKIGSE